MNSVFKKLFPLSLRGGALASKFILIIFISHYYDLADLGEYALIVAGVSYLGYLLGFDFYTYSSRNIIGASKNDQALYLKNQFSLYFFHYTIAIILLVITLSFSPVIGEVAITFVVLMILEHCSQEIMRLLVVFKHPLGANLQFFIRNGLWVYLYILFVYLYGDVAFNVIWYFWIAAEIVSLLFVFVILNRIPFALITKSKIDWGWIYHGIKICLPLLISTLCLRGIFTVDRYILGVFEDKHVVGVYSYFSSFSSSIMAFVDAGVVMLFYPRLVEYYKQSNSIEFIRTKSAFLKSIIVTSVCISIILLICVPFISKMSGKNDFLKSLPIFYVLLAGAVIYCISLVYHFELYARNLDKFIIYSSVLAFSVSMVLMLILGYYYSSIGIAISQLVGIIVLFLAKYKFCKSR